MPAPTSPPPAPVGINGFGRIGRAAFRLSLDRDDVEVVAINHTAPSLEYLLHSIKYDSVHGLCRHASELSIVDDHLDHAGRKITLFSQRDPAMIDWASAGAEYVLESTGKMTTTALAQAHVASGAKKVIISAPSKDAKTFVYGVNQLEYTPEMNVVSNASCTTNCLAPLAKVLNDSYGIVNGMMTTVHASTSSQHILDGYSKKSRRLGRGVSGNIIPTTTGAAKAVQLVLPELAGKFTGTSVRVPVQNVSMVDLVCTLSTPVASVEELLKPLREASLSGPLSKVLLVSDDELVSSDFCGYAQSSVVDSEATIALNEYTFKVISWYDNEMGYSSQCLNLIAHMMRVDEGFH